MKNKLLILLTTISLLSCDDRLDFLADVNNAPVLSITKDGEILSNLNVDFKMLDDIKGPGEEFYQVTLFIEDSEGFDGTLEPTFISGLGRVLDVDKNPIEGAIGYKNKEALTLYYDAQGIAGIAKIRLTATDNLGKSSSVELTISAFKNKRPVAAWEFTKPAINDPYEYEFDATSSVDDDAAQGGGIVRYEWNVNGTIFSTSSPKIRYILSKASTNGTNYSVKLRVKDNNAEFSTNVAEKIISVN